MLIGSTQKLSTLSSQPELSIDNVPIVKYTSVKSLGIYIDENLRWQTHFDKLSKKIASGIGAIKSGCQRKPGKMLKISTEGGQQNKFILTSQIGLVE